MFPRSIKLMFAAAAAALVGFMPAAPAMAAQDAGITIPISTGALPQGTFTGNLKITSFAVQNNTLVASGLVTGTVAGAGGALQSVVQTVTIPVATGGTTGATTAATGAGTNAAAASSCGILNLTLGPLDLNLLGLTVHLDRIVLNIGATPGSGNLLGNLLCSVAGLLNNTSALTQLANTLNQILAAL